MSEAVELKGVPRVSEAPPPHHKGGGEPGIQVQAQGPAVVAAGLQTKQSMLSSHDLLENGVATFVDVSSIMVAYAIGMHESSFLLGLAYGFLDAFMVVWMRKPFARAIRWLLSFRSGVRT